jgi:hypothetical protein
MLIATGEFILAKQLLDEASLLAEISSQSWVEPGLYRLCAILGEHGVDSGDFASEYWLKRSLMQAREHGQSGSSANHTIHKIPIRHARYGCISVSSRGSVFSPAMIDERYPNEFRYRRRLRHSRKAAGSSAKLRPYRPCTSASEKGCPETGDGWRWLDRNQSKAVMRAPGRPALRAVPGVTRTSTRLRLPPVPGCREADYRGEAVTSLGSVN